MASPTTIRLEVMPRAAGYQLVRGFGGAKRVITRHPGGGAALAQAYAKARDLREAGATLDDALTTALGKA